MGETNSGGGGLYGSKANGTSPTSTMDEPKVALRIVEDSSREEFPDSVEEDRKGGSPRNRALIEDGISDAREEEGTLSAYPMQSEGICRARLTAC